MLRVYGKRVGDEAEAAAQMTTIIRAAWPWVDNDPETDLALIAGMKCYGQKRQDIDLVVLGMVGEKGFFTPLLEFLTKDGESIQDEPVRVESLCLAVEVKRHDSAGIRFTGVLLAVNYGTAAEPRWHDVSEQSHEQAISLRNFIGRHRLTSPWVTNLIWLMNVPSVFLPSRPHNVVGSKFSWEYLLSVATQLHPPKYYKGRWNLTVEAKDERVPFGRVVQLLTATIVPTVLDRKRMDQILAGHVQQQWLDLLESKMLVLRGRGGTGKTVLLLQLAWQAYQSRKARVLLLTYNRALAADLRRLFTLMGLPTDVEIDGIRIRTAISYFRGVLRCLGVLPAGAQDFFERYAEYKAEVLQLFAGGALGADDVGRNRREHPDDFDWDFVFIDESQDWPEDERDLLRRLYPDSPFALTDGQDQLVRRPRACDWTRSVEKFRVRVINRTICLRMKANLAAFANSLARELGLASWSVEVNTEALGGQVFVVVGDYLKHKDLHQELLHRTKEAGNAVIDLLGCVPPTGVGRDPERGHAFSLVGRRFLEMGQPVWDGVDEEQRESYPTSVEQFRVVQYDSCRGLEGWMAFLFALDDFFEYKRLTWRGPEGEEALLPDDPDAAFLFAARWLMIPLTRAMDTLVLEVGKAASPLKETLRRVAGQHPDFVRWIE